MVDIDDTTKDSRLLVLKPSLHMRFNQAYWGDSAVQCTTNCYAYAINCPDAGMAAPGLLQSMDQDSAYPEAFVTTENVQSFLADGDGLEPITEEDALSGKFHAVALKIWPGKDYHFFRYDQATGLWSHKLSNRPISNLDDAGQTIKNPRLARSNNYTEFGGYFKIPEQGIFYAPVYGYMDMASKGPL